MARSEKTMQLANFNITFGDSNEPLLNHFEDYLYPAMRANLNHKTGKSTYYFDDVKLKCIHGSYVLTGLFVKDTTYQIRTVVEDNKLVERSNSIPTAPYSRFIVFLDCHRMVLVKNEGASPTARNMQTTLIKVMKEYRRLIKKDADKNADIQELPVPFVSIVLMPMAEDIRATLMSFEKIKSVTLHFFPLNNDLDSSDLLKAAREQMNKVGSKSGKTIFNSPKSVNGAVEMIDSCTHSGLASVTVKGEMEDGALVTIKDNDYNSTCAIPIAGNVASSDDGKIVDYVRSSNRLSVPSVENSRLYRSKISVFVELCGEKGDSLSGR